LEDYIGGFAVTAGVGLEAFIDRYYPKDDYSRIMSKILADRLSEAFAERLHELIRKKYWAYAKDEELSIQEIIKEKYRGIRPAPGYPPCPEHSEKETLFRILDVEKNSGISLTESYMMMPAASVSGWYFAHPDSKYFVLGKIDRDQALDYSKRKDISLETALKLLSPVMN